MPSWPSKSGSVLYLALLLLSKIQHLGAGVSTNRCQLYDFDEDLIGDYIRAGLFFRAATSRIAALKVAAKFVRHRHVSYKVEFTLYQTIQKLAQLYFKKRLRNKLTGKMAVSFVGNAEPLRL